MAKKGAKRSKGSQPREGYLPGSGGNPVKIGDTVGPPSSVIKPFENDKVPNWGGQNSGKTRSKGNRMPEVFIDQKAKGTIGPVNPLGPTKPIPFPPSVPDNAVTQRNASGITEWQRYKDGTADPDYVVDRVSLNRQIGANYGKRPPEWTKLAPIQDSVDRVLTPGERLFKSEFINKGGSSFRSGDVVFLFDDSGRQINDAEASQFERNLREDNPGANFVRTGNRTWERSDGSIFEAYPAPIPLARDVRQSRTPKPEPTPDIELDVVGEPDPEPEVGRGTYYFNKGRFLTRGKYNVKTSSRTTQRRG